MSSTQDRPTEDTQGTEEVSGSLKILSNGEDSDDNDPTRKRPCQEDQPTCMTIDD